ncbi:MAG: hypothetical protein LPK21_09820 [Hymenobacteraceae bacterium]|nr:hypothetical protein [Hymenobacteraceae bacterium]
MTSNETNTTTKFYSQRAIAIATYFGGPLAAGVLIRQNFINLGNAEYGKRALIVGIVSTVLLFAGIFSIPDHIIEKVPNFLIPAIYTFLIYLVVERLQGPLLKSHKQANGSFYSGWKAAGVGSICMVVLLGVIFGYAFMAPDDFDTAKYDNGIAEFQKNEEKALTLYAMLEAADTEQTSAFIQETGIPAWQQNIKLLQELDNIEGLYQEYKDQNQVLREYCQLRIEAYQLIGKALQENSTVYEQQIEAIDQRIDKVLEKL